MIMILKDSLRIKVGVRSAYVYTTLNRDVDRIHCIRRYINSGKFHLYHPGHWMIWGKSEKSQYGGRRTVIATAAGETRKIPVQ